jgi:hypothetical protein
MFLAWRKWITVNFTTDRLSIAGHIITPLYGQEHTLGDQLCECLQGNESCDATSHARALPHSYISCLK